MRFRYGALIGLIAIGLTVMALACSSAEEPEAPAAAATAAPAQAAQAIVPSAEPAKRPASALPAATARPASQAMAAPLPTPTPAAMVRVVPTAMVITDPIFGGTIKMISRGSPPSLDRSFTNASGSGYPGEHIYERPFGWDSKLSAEPELVSDWDMSSDGLVLTLNFREARLHTGDMLT